VRKKQIQQAVSALGKKQRLSSQKKSVSSSVNDDILLGT
jgi:hypothetical protein